MEPKYTMDQRSFLTKTKHIFFVIVAGISYMIGIVSSKIFFVVIQNCINYELGEDLLEEYLVSIKKESKLCEKKLNENIISREEKCS